MQERIDGLNEFFIPFHAYVSQRNELSMTWRFGVSLSNKFPWPFNLISPSSRILCEQKRPNCGIPVNSTWVEQYGQTTGTRCCSVAECTGQSIVLVNLVGAKPATNT